MKNISIAIPTYNSAIYLEKLLNKITKFEIVNEILISDDGSESSDLEKIEHLSEKYKRTRKLKF